MARATGSVKHIHQYYRRANGLWYCSGIEECTHYVPKNMPEPVGRRSICWDCGNAFQLTPVNMDIDKPKCDTCLERAELTNKYLEENPLPPPIKSTRNTLDEMMRRGAENARKRQEEQEEREREALLEDNPEVYEPTDEN